MTLIEFLRARLDEEQQGAEQCTEKRWRPDGANSCQVYARHRTIAWCANGYDDDFANSLHIARHDPARVLAEVDAKRRIIALAETAAELATDNPTAYVMVGAAAAHKTVLQHLALPYADHPDYQEAWRP